MFWVLVAVILLHPISGQSNFTDFNLSGVDNSSDSNISGPSHNKEGFDISFLEPLLDQLADFSFYTVLTAFVGCGFQLLVVFLVPQDWSLFHIVVGSYLGFLYLGYSLTIPFYGFPEDCVCPEFPHLGPAPADWERCEKIARTIYNSVMLAVVPYLLILVALVLMGVILLAPPVCILVGSFLVLSRFSHYVSVDLAEKIELTKGHKEEAKDKKPDAKALVPIIALVQVPFWTLRKLNFFFNLEMPVFCFACGFELEDFGCESCPSCAFCGALNFLCCKLPTHFCTISLPKCWAFICPSLRFRCAINFFCCELPTHFCTISLPKCWALICPSLRFRCAINFFCCELPTHFCTISLPKCWAFICPSLSFRCAISFFCCELPIHFCTISVPRCCGIILPTRCSIICPVMKFLCWKLPVLFFTILLPSFFKFYFDILFVLTIFRTFSFTFPSFSMPGFSVPSFSFGFALFSFNLPTFTFPRLFGKCGSTGDMGTLLVLSAAVFTSSVIITSDIMVALFDRDRRGKMLTRSLEDEKKEEEKQKQMSYFSLEYICHKVKIYVVKAEAAIGGGARYVILWFTGIVMNEATLSFALLTPRLMAGKESDASSSTACTWGMFVSIRILQIYIMACTVVYFYKVLSGSVHKDGIYILSAALVQEEYLLRWKQLSRVVALVRLSVGQFLLPMLPVGLTSQDAEQIDDLIMTRQRSNNRASASLSEGDVMGLTKELSGRLTPKEDRIGVYATLKNIFSAKQTLIEALLDMALKEDMHDKENNKAAVDARDQPELRDFQDFRLREFTALVRARKGRKDDNENDENENHGSNRCLEKVATFLTSPFTVMGDWQAKSAYVSERCCVWQSQLESVHKATCFSVALTILLVPLGGAFMCKSCQWLSEVPALLWSNVKEVCHYSFYWTHSDETDFVKADLWCQGALGMVLLRIVVAGLAFFKTDFWSLFVCGCASSLLCLGQNEFMKKNDEANSVRIASYIVAEKPDLKLQDAGSSSVSYSAVLPHEDPESQHQGCHRRAAEHLE